MVSGTRSMSICTIAAAICLLLFSSEVNGNTIDCVPIDVTFSWTLVQTGNKLGSARVYDYVGPVGNSKNVTTPFFGGFTIGTVHTPPANYCERITPLPTTVALHVEGTMSWFLMNSTLGTAGGLVVETHAIARAWADSLPPFGEHKVGMQPFGVTDSELQKAELTRGAGTLNYNAYAYAETLYGFGFPIVNQVAAWSDLVITGHLEQGGVSGSIIRIPITYLVPIPEPATLLLLGTGLAGLGGMTWRRGRRT